MVLLVELKISCIRNLLLCFIGLFTIACSEEFTDGLVTSEGVLQIKVATNRIETKGAIFDSYLPDKSSVGIWLTDSNGESYDPLLDETFELYTANGVGAEQTWSAHRPIPLDSRTATVYACYPKADSNGSVNVTNDQTDYMYATPTTVSKSKPLASLVLNHALSIIEISCVKNNAFSGAGSITAFRISGSAVSGGGILDVKTGKLSDLSSRATIELPVSGMTLSETPSVGHVIVIPRGVSGELTLSVKVDNVWYSVKANPISLQQGKKYHYDLSIGREYAQVGEVQVTDWVDNHVGDETIEYGNFKINLTGDKENLAFAHSVSNGVVTIKAVSLSSAFYPSVVTKSGYATLSQSLSESKVRTVKLSSIMSDVDVQFDGLSGGELIISGTTTGLTVTKERTSDNSFRVVATPTGNSTYAVSPTIGSGTGKLSHSLSKFVRTIDVTNMKSNVVLNFNGTGPITDLISYTGNTSGLNPSATVNSSGVVTVTITPSNSDNYPKPVTIGTNATLTSDQTLTFDGTSVRSFTMTMTDACSLSLNGYVQTQSWSNVNTDGVYYVDLNGKRCLNPSTSCPAIVLVNTYTNQKFMIEKYESDGQWTEACLDYFSSSENFCWGDSATISGCTAAGVILQDIPTDPSQWTENCLKDFAGYDNTIETCVYALDNWGKSTSFSKEYASLIHVYLYVNDWYEKQYTPWNKYWYLPAMGQLALIAVNLEAINSALTRIGGKGIQAEQYWSSTQNTAYDGSTFYANSINMSSVSATFGQKNTSPYRMRFIRDVP